MGIKSAKSRKRQDAKQSRKQQGLQERQIRLPDPDQEFGKITKVLGDCRFRIMLPNEKEYLGILCRRLFRRVWIQMDHIVLVSLRDFQQDKVDIIHRYADEDVRQLMKQNTLSSRFVLGESVDTTAEKDLSSSFSPFSLDDAPATSFPPNTKPLFSDQHSYNPPPSQAQDIDISTI